METIIGEEGRDETLPNFGIPVAGSGSSRLSYDNSSSFEINRKKRRISGVGFRGSNDTISDVNISAESFSSVTKTQTTQIAQSPWETRRMKADLIEARSRITVLKKEIEHQNTEMTTTVLRKQHKISSLEQELSHATKKLTDLEKHLVVLRKREHAAKEELVKTRNQFNLLKQTSSDQHFELQQTMKSMEEKYESDVGELHSEIRDLSSQVTELEQRLTLAQDELDTTREINDTLQSKADAYDQTNRQLEETAERLAEAESRVKALEYEVGSYEDWKNLSKVSMARLANSAEMEKENHRLKEELKNLRGVIGNKLLLEEQVANLQSRLEHFEQKEMQTAALEVRLKELEQELLDWRQLGKDYSQQGGSQSAANPKAMRKLIVEILQKDVVLTSEQSSVRNERNRSLNRTKELESENTILLNNLNELKRSLKYHQSVMHRVQKKLQLVIGERNFLKQLLESYEKDLTINQSVVSNQEGHMRTRIEMLERTLAGYQELCQKLEDELHSSKSLPDMALGSALTSDQYEKLRNEIDHLRLQNEKLQSSKEKLELEVQNHTLRSMGGNDAKVLVMSASLASEQFAEKEANVVKLQAEVERLRARMRKLEEDNGDLSDCLTNTASTSNMTMQVKEMNNVKAQLQSLEAKYQHSKEMFRKTSQEFRDVCYMLFGYRVDLVNGKNYRLSSQYAESPEEYLNFRLNEDGSMLNMLETDYSRSLDELVKTHLRVDGSLPAFLSTLTLDLFHRTTVMVHQ